MLPSLSRGLRLALVLALSAGYVTWHGHARLAEAAPKGGGDDEGGDDDDSGPKDEGDDAADDDKDQPPVTAGGLFTMKTYPVNELLRPLTITQNMGQLRAGVGTDASSLGAFSSLGLSLEGEYGVADNFMVIGGFTSAYNFAQLGFYGGFEGSLLYDLVDIRLAANVHRFAVPHLCGDPRDGMPPAGCKDPMDMTGATLLPLPDGKYSSGKTQFSLDLGFPFRYDVKPEIAIIALQTLMSIDFNGVAGNSATPDINPSIGIATNPIPQLSLVVFAQLRVVDANFDAANFQVPVTGRVEFSPNQQLDIGLEFTLLNIKPPDPQKPFDNRFLSLFVQSRFGK